jgi:hypothetical protein
MSAFTKLSDTFSSAALPLGALIASGEMDSAARKNTGKIIRTAQQFNIQFINNSVSVIQLYRFL